MQIARETEVLDHYLGLIDADRVAFLSNRPAYQESVRLLIVSLRDAPDMHGRIHAAKALWKELFEAAMSSIDPDKRGYDELFSYFDAYVDFEELLFASDAFYRDHTLHCLWVYFLGQWIAKRPEFETFMRNFASAGDDSRMLTGLLQRLTDGQSEEIRKAYSPAMNAWSFLDTMARLQDAQVCVAALTHDLDYPLKKIHKINRAIGSILPAFAIRTYDEFSFDFSALQTSFVEQFLRNLCLEFKFSFKFGDAADPDMDRLVQDLVSWDQASGSLGLDEARYGKLDEKTKLALAGRFSFAVANTYESSVYMRYSADFEQYEHGMMSAFLLARTLEAFKSSRTAYTDYAKLEFSEEDTPLVFVKNNILQAVIDHTSSGYSIRKPDMGSAFLAIVDELEEFSRISRAAQSRQFVNEFCKTVLYSEGGRLCADFVFDNAELPSLDPARSFKGKAKRFLSMFDIRKLAADFSMRLRFIGKVPQCSDVYELEIGAKHARIRKNGETLDIPSFLGTRQFWTSEEYAKD